MSAPFPDLGTGGSLGMSVYLPDCPPHVSTFLSLLQVCDTSKQNQTPGEVAKEGREPLQISPSVCVMTDVIPRWHAQVKMLTGTSDPEGT